MSAQIQLDFFKETTTEDVMRADFAELSQSHHAVRRRTFAEIRALQKMIMDQQNEIDLLKMKAGLACIVRSES